jgi:NADH:ubiquinone oxidoreductase subunit 3 (subunit A)
MNLLLTPIAAFTLYFIAAAALSGIGRLLAARGRSDPQESSIYAGGERPPQAGALPGYTGMFVIALFFAMVHVGVLMLASSGGSALAALYLIALAVSLLALILG